MKSKIIVENAIFQEAKIVKINPSKARFRMVLQTVDQKNQNKRIYPSSVLTEGMRECNQRIGNRAFLGELDHPIPKGTSADGVRQSTVLLKEASHMITGYQFEGNKLVGELETTHTPNGKILLGLLQDRAGIGMSMRGMAELDRRNDGNYVKSPLYIISYDSVSNPSHQSAVVDFNNMRFESSVIQESCGVVCTPSGKCYLADYFDKLVETKIIEFQKKWF